MASSTNPPQSYGFLVFPGFQALDAFGPLDALNNLSIHSKMNLSIISSTLDPVSTQITSSEVNIANSAFAQSVVPTHTFSTAPPIDFLLVPGGFGIRASDSELKGHLDFIARVFPSLRYLFTVCTGSILAARAGVLDGLNATTNKAAWSRLTPLYPKVNWDVTKRWVTDQDGKVWTASGVTAGIDAVYAWIEEVHGAEEAQRLVNMAEYVRSKDPSDEPFARLYGLVWGMRIGARMCEWGKAVAEE